MAREPEDKQQRQTAKAEADRQAAEQQAQQKATEAEQAKQQEEQAKREREAQERADNPPASGKPPADSLSEDGRLARVEVWVPADQTSQLKQAAKQMRLGANIADSDVPSGE